MIHGTEQLRQSLSWQEQLAQAIRQPEELLKYVGLTPYAIGYSQHAITQFPVLVPHAFADRIEHQNPDDPILRQVFPYIDEENEIAGYVKDPLEELDVQTAQGLLQKYKSRVLSITTAACAVHCRYCFRRHFPYKELSATKQHWQTTLDHIENDTSIHEVILSGGDPLTLSDQRLAEICTSISNIKHIKRIRFHTRLPIVLPDRISDSLLKQITHNNKSVIFVIHSNHANEIDENVAKAIQRLQKFGISILNQSVLLKGVNDSATTLIQLSERLIENNITPYYLHLLDPVTDAAHYDVETDKAKQILQEMQNNVSGYLVPKLVREEVGKASKTLINN